MISQQGLASRRKEATHVRIDFERTRSPTSYEVFLRIMPAVVASLVGEHVELQSLGRHSEKESSGESRFEHVEGLIAES